MAEILQDFRGKGSFSPAETPVAADLSPRDVGGILDQLYRAATGQPRRFYLRREDLKALAGRKRARPEFFEEIGRELEIVHSILMSYPRLARGWLIGFVSERLAQGWPAASAENVRKALTVPLDGDWALSVRKRLQRLHALGQIEGKLPSPVLVTETQLCRTAQMRKFEETWWRDLAEGPKKAPPDQRLSFFA
jgi:hypothetical protein